MDAHATFQKEKGWSVYFRSVLELIKIIDGVLDEKEQAAGTENSGE